MITKEDLENNHDFDAAEDLVEDALKRALSSPEALLCFMGRYTSWNGFFGSGVATLAGKIGRARGLFHSSEQPIHALADRSVHVASFFFDAAVDEFNDSSTPHRDTHRTLAQACIAGVVGWARTQGSVRDDDAVNALLSAPLWLAALHDRVAIGYGAASPDDLANIFRAMGYHLGSEVLADREFSLIDDGMREHTPEVVDYLEREVITLAGEQHNAYHWLGIHSGHGGAVEWDHFKWAVQGVDRGFRYTDPALHEDLRAQLHLGFTDFARDHRVFFENA